MRQPVSIAIWTALVCLIGCGGRDKQLEAGVEVKGVATLGEDLVYVQSSGVMQRIDVMAGDPKPQTTKTPIRSAPRTLAKRRPQPTASNAATDGGVSQPTDDELLIVSDGRTDNYGQVVDKPALTRVKVDNEQDVYDLSQPGQLMRLSGDGNYAVLFDDPSQSASDTLLTNRNEIAIVDLRNPPGEGNPNIRTLNAVGGSPQALWFAPLTVGSELKDFVLFSFPKGVSLRDLTVPDDLGHKLELGNWVPAAGSGAAPVADVQVDTKAAKIYLRNSVSADVQVLTVGPVTDANGQVVSDQVDVSQNTLTVGTSAPSDFRVYSRPDIEQPDTTVTRLVATVGKAVAIVDADSNTVTTVAIPYTADRILTFDGTAPKDANTKHRALLYGAGQSGVTFVDLEDLEQKTTKALQGVDLGAALASVLQIPKLENSLILFLAGGGIEVLDLQTRRWSPIGSAASITATIADPSLNRAWVAIPGDKRVGYLDFGDPTDATLRIGEIKLDDPVSQFFRLDSGTDQRVIVTHEHVGGSLTFFDANKPARSTAKKLEGFLLSDLL